MLFLYKCKWTITYTLPHVKMLTLKAYVKWDLGGSVWVNAKNVSLLSKVREGFHYEHNALELFSAIPCRAG